MKRNTIRIILLLFLIFNMFSNKLIINAADRLQTFKQEVPIIVIDPGHGGENEGTIENNHLEKEMTMITAIAMYQELKLYDNVEVYLTRTEDIDLSLKDRAQIAADYNADLLISVHYNASENHELFGSEIWIPSTVPFNAYCYQFGYEFLTQMQSKGLLIRGIKTRLNDKGTDYYGIIRESTALDIPAVILEHCHVDEKHDEIFCATEEDLIQFGKEDATALAKYFGLKSEYLEVDYNEYDLVTVPHDSVVTATFLDETPPDICEIEFISADYDNGYISIQVSATDYDSPLLYYSYSIDGGITYTERFAWPGSDILKGFYNDTFQLNLQIPSGTAPKIILRAYNQFDIITESNLYVSPTIFSYGLEADTTFPQEEESISNTREEIKTVVNTENIIISDTDSQDTEVSFLTFLKLCLAVVLFLFFVLLFSLINQRIIRNRRRNYNKNVDGYNNNQNK